MWSLLELQELLDEWTVAAWQNRPHDGLRDPAHPGRMFSPNEKYAALVETVGYVPVALSAEDYVELLPATWRAINAYGVKISYRTYDDQALNPLRHQRSGVRHRKDLWEIRFDPYDVSRVWVRDHWRGGWITLFWKQLQTIEVIHRRRHPHPRSDIPVVYITVPPAATPKMIAMEFTRFFGLPLSRRANITDIANAVCGVSLDGRVTLVAVDELHNLNTARSGTTQQVHRIRPLRSRRAPARPQVPQERRHRRDDHAIDINNPIRLKQVTRRLNRSAAQHPQRRQIPPAIPSVDHGQGTQPPARWPTRQTRRSAPVVQSTGHQARLGAGELDAVHLRTGPGSGRARPRHGTRPGHLQPLPRPAPADSVLRAAARPRASAAHRLGDRTRSPALSALATTARATATADAWSGAATETTQMTSSAVGPGESLADPASATRSAGEHSWFKNAAIS